MRVTGSLIVVERQAGPIYFLKARDRDGRQIKRRLGPVADWPRKQAQDALRDFLTDLGRVPDRGDGSVTFKYAAGAWLRYVEHDEGGYRRRCAQAVARATGTEQDAALILVAAFTGLRLGELRGLRWRDVNFANKLVHVRRSYTGADEGPPKSGKARSVPLIDTAARALDGLSRRERFTGADDRVFCSPTGGVLDEGQIRDTLYATLDARRDRPRPRDRQAARVPRPAPHVRDAGRADLPAVGRAGVHGPREHRDDDDLRASHAAARRRRPPRAACQSRCRRAGRCRRPARPVGCLARLTSGAKKGVDDVLRFLDRQPETGSQFLQADPLHEARHSLPVAGVCVRHAALTGAKKGLDVVLRFLDRQPEAGSNFLDADPLHEARHSLPVAALGRHAWGRIGDSRSSRKCKRHDTRGGCNWNAEHDGPSLLKSQRAVLCGAGFSGEPIARET